MIATVLHEFCCLVTFMHTVYSIWNDSNARITKVLCSFSFCTLASLERHGFAESSTSNLKRMREWFLLELHKLREGIERIRVFLFSAEKPFAISHALSTKSNLKFHCWNPWQDDFWNLMAIAYVKSITQYINTSTLWMVVFMTSHTMRSIKTFIQLENNVNYNNSKRSLKQE